jgi:hypothetical protein
MSEPIDISPEVVERLAAFADTDTIRWPAVRDTLRAISARLAEVEADRDECRRMMRLERQIADKNAARAEAAEAQLALAMEALRDGMALTSEHGGAAKFLKLARTVLAEIGGDA